MTRGDDILRDDTMPAEKLHDPPLLNYPREFVDFLHWLQDDQGYAANAIIHVIEKPHNYRDEWNTYLNLGGPDRPTNDERTSDG